MNSRVGQQAGRGFSVLIICEANICRSPAIAFAALLAGAPEVTSAGLNARTDLHLCPLVAERISSSPRGNACAESFTPVPVQSLELNEFELLLSATTSLRGEFVRQNPGLRGRAFTVLEAVRLASLPATSEELIELRANGLAGVLAARRGTIATEGALVSGRKTGWRKHVNALDISDGHNDQRKRHHQATVDLASGAGADLAARLLEWQDAAVDGAGA